MGLCFSLCCDSDDSGDNGDYSGNNGGDYSGGQDYSGGGNYNGDGTGDAYALQNMQQNYALESEAIAMEGQAAQEASAGGVLTWIASLEGLDGVVTVSSGRIYDSWTPFWSNGQINFFKLTISSEKCIGSYLVGYYSV